MNLDLRLPMGLMFSLVGLILTVFGLATNGDPMYARSLGINANLDWGVILLAFGLVMFFLGRRGQRASSSSVPKSLPQNPPRRGH